MSSFQELVDGHQGLVKKIALSISQRVRTQVPLDDMIGYGQLGLIQAARAYNEKSQAKFSTYAYYRISGAIYDGLWQMDWSSRAEHRKLKASQLANDLRDPQREELSEENAQDRLSGSTGTDDLAGELGWANRTIAGLAAIYFFSGLASEENAFDVESAGRDPQAETELRRLIRRYPLFADARAALTALLWSQGQAGEAESNWAAASGLDQRYRDPSWLLEVRRWPPQPVEELQRFLRLEAAGQVHA